MKERTGYISLGALVICCGLLWGPVIRPAFTAPSPSPSTTAPSLSPSMRWFDTLDLSQQRDSLVAAAARQAGVPVHLLIALSHAENWSGDSAAVNPRSGAIGLMQIMPGWQHSFEDDCGGGSLMNRRRNVCVGAHIYLRYVDSLKRVEPTLRAYVGQRSERSRPIGDRYVADVLENLARLSP